jgi:Arc/MetJ family transcription regulator
MEMFVVPNFDINWNELEQIEIDDELENTFLRLTALDVPLNIHIDENTIVTVAKALVNILSTHFDCSNRTIAV